MTQDGSKMQKPDFARPQPQSVQKAIGQNPNLSVSNYSNIQKELEPNKVNTQGTKVFSNNNISFGKAKNYN